MDAWQSFPLGLALAFLWGVAMLRGQVTYWIARSVTEQTLRHTRPTSGWRAAVHRWLSSDAVDRGRGAVERCGIGAVPLCYLTVGLQTVVLASAGVLRMRWWRFTLAQSVGALAWAAIYATVGFAIWALAFEALLAGGPWLAAGLAVALTLLVALGHRWYAVRRRRGRSAADEVTTARSRPASAPR
ncbi:VTT domain-containing protein [uncultured Serinicoccus sp.]|uniref:DedA family protein n=1 Tax=uncultured Serinicoccus sp. TaxID=735514 RepID=UPI00260C4C81|nr:VTT domain-containing protein [uncultured Serinicoccus sp.]